MWLLIVLLALSPSLLLVLYAQVELIRDRRRREAMRRHPSIVGRERRVVREAEDLLRSTQ